jgi:flagellar basal-body rod protein FlgB
VDSSSALLMIKALDGLSARAVVTAENIANAGTPNYRPIRLTFERALQDAALQGDEAVQAVIPRLERALATAPDGELRLDMELATASTTAMRYSALIDVLNRQMQIHSLAVTGTV